MQQPQFSELDGDITYSSAGWIYFERVDVGEDEEPHDVVEPLLTAAKEIIAAAGYVIDNDETGCDHDSLWVYFSLPAGSSTPVSA